MYQLRAKKRPLAGNLSDFQRCSRRVIGESPALEQRLLNLDDRMLIVQEKEDLALAILSATGY